MVTAFGKDDIERLGLVKLDLLGPKTLTAMQARRRADRARLGPLPFNDAKAFQLMRGRQDRRAVPAGGRRVRPGVRQLRPDAGSTT